MSTGVTIVNEEDFYAALTAVRSDSTDTNWFLCDHNDDRPDEVGLVGAGSGGVNELVECLDDGKYMYGLVRMTVTIDMSETTKFAYIYWVGKDVPFVKKGKFGIKSGALMKIFEPFQVSLEFDGDDKSVVTEDLVMNKFQESSGTKNKVLEAAEAKDRPERGFTAGASSTTKSSGAGGNIGSKVGKQGTSYSGITSVAKSGSSISYDESVAECIAAVRSDGDDTTWACVKFEENNLRKPLVVANLGEDCAKISENFKDEEVACVLLRMNDIVDDIATVKFVYVLWVGEKVKPMSKGKLSTCKGDLEELFQPFHVHIHATQHSEVRYQVIQDKVGAASGSKSNIK